MTRFPHRFDFVEVPGLEGQPFGCRCGKYGFFPGLRGSGCTAAMRERIAELEAEVAQLRASYGAPLPAPEPLPAAADPPDPQGSE